MFDAELIHILTKHFWHTMKELFKMSFSVFWPAVGFEPVTYQSAVLDAKTEPTGPMTCFLTEQVKTALLSSVC